ncbi:MAG: V4R domain-containing protein [Candidatus Promineifilaceae bacterium]
MPDSIPLTGYYYPNKMGRILFLSLEEVMGQADLETLLHHSHLSQYIHNLPPEDYERQFDFAHIANLLNSLEQLYGPRGSRNLAIRSGKAMFEHGLRNFGTLAGVAEPSFKVLPLSTKLKIGLPTVARIFTQLSDQVSHVEEKEEHYLYYIDRCPMCWGRHADHPVCHISTSILQTALYWVSDGQEFRVEEIECIAMGHTTCIFRVDKEPIK